LTVDEEAVAQLRVRAELLDAIEQAVIATDLQGRITYWNHFAERLYGWNASDVVGRNIEDVTPSEMSREQATTIMERLRSGQSWSGEFQVRRRDGTRFPALVTDTPLRGASGELVGVVGISSDLTEAKNAQHALEAALAREQDATLRATESLTLLDVLVGSAPIGIVFFDSRLRFVRLNQALADMDGLPLEAHVGRTVREVMPELADRVEPALLRVLTTGEPLRDVVVETAPVTQPDAPRAWRTSCYPVRGASGEIVGVGAIAVDITQQQQLEADREYLLKSEREQRARLREILDALPEAVVIAERASGTFTLANRASLRVMGVDFTGRIVPGATEHAFNPRHLDGSPLDSDELPLHRALRGEKVSAAQYIYHNDADNRDVPLLINGAPLHDSAGNVVGALCVFQDISAMRDLDRQKDEFLGAVSHDLQQPLAIIKGRTQLLLRQLQQESLEHNRLGKSLASIESTVDDMGGLLAELLDATRLQMGRPLELRLETTELVSLLGEIVASWTSVAAAPLITLETELRSMVLTADPVRVRRVISNLLSNAVKYNRDHAPISVRLTRDRGEAVIEVEDHGMGIPERDIPRIFERFFRAQNVGRTSIGSGIGLAGARQIVLDHGGSIDVHSREGLGSTFVVRLPL
jgi:PAS domain S-box-containing protein